MNQAPAANPPRVAPSSNAYSPLWNLIVARLKEFVRQREAIFWSYFFPVLMVMVLGSAFTTRREPAIAVDIVSGEQAASVRQLLQSNPRFVLRETSSDEARQRLKMARTDLVVSPSASIASEIEYQYDPLRPESSLARLIVDDALQAAAGRKNPVKTNDYLMREPGSRYVDFLVPGLLGLNIMSGGLFGLGFSIVQMRIKKLLKRLMATPMKRSQFLFALMISRLVFLIPGVFILFGFAWLTFGFQVQGSYLSMMAFVLLGAYTFSGIGLLIGCRTSTIEVVTGIMNLIMLPMWLFSGVFFSTDRFPAAVQPIIKCLPLTPLIDGLRATALEGASLFAPAQLVRVVLLLLWGTVTFVVALRLFKWN